MECWLLAMVLKGDRSRTKTELTCPGSNIDTDVSCGAGERDESRWPLVLPDGAQRPCAASVDSHRAPSSRALWRRRREAAGDARHGDTVGRPDRDWRDWSGDRSPGVVAAAAGAELSQIVLRPHRRCSRYGVFSSSNHLHAIEICCLRCVDIESFACDAKRSPLYMTSASAITLPSKYPAKSSMSTLLSCRNVKDGLKSMINTDNFALHYAFHGVAHHIRERRWSLALVFNAILQAPHCRLEWSAGSNGGSLRAANCCSHASAVCESLRGFQSRRMAAF